MPRSDVNKEYYTQNMEREVIIWVLAVIIYDICHLFKKKKLEGSRAVHSDCKLN